MKRGDIPKEYPMPFFHRSAARLVPALSILLLTACMSSGPEKTLGAMADALSANDSSAFMAHMDMKRFSANEIANMTQESRSLNMLDSLGRRLGIGGVDKMLNSIVDVENDLRRHFNRGVATGELMADCRQAATPDCPWVPESLRKARVVKIDESAAVASVTTPAGMTSWLALRKQGENWQVVGQAALEDTARKYALGKGAAPSGGTQQPDSRGDKPAPVDI